MKFEKVYTKRNRNIKIGLFILVGVIITVSFVTSKASYRTTQSINVANGTINYSPGDVKLVSIKVQASLNSSTYTDSDTVPTGKYILNTTKSYCEYDNNGTMTNINTNMSYDSTNGNVTIDLTKKGTKCYLYFDKHNNVTVSDIIASAKSGGSNSVTSTCTNSNCTGLYYIKDGANMYGEDNNTYYYRGLVNNNWVYFAGIYWRIIRINGDGSIRMIYSGTTAPTSSTATVMTGTGTQLSSKSAYNSSYDNAAYVGFYYSTSNGHATASNGTKSTIATQLDTWYDGLFGTGKTYASLASKIDQSGKFCNDRYLNGSYGSTYTGTSGYGTTAMAFAPFRRTKTDSGSWLTTQTIETNCTNTSDIFTRNVGLITVDEVLMAGGFGESGNSSYWLYTNQTYWTMSPYHFNGSTAGMFYVYSYGSLGYVSVNSLGGVRPVINLVSGTMFTEGTDGTYSKPYTVI